MYVPRNGSLQYQIMQMLGDGISKNNNTRKSQIRGIKDFASWCKKELGIKKLTEKDDFREILQKYSNSLQAKDYTAGTIHTKLASPCKALGVKMSEITKPKRTQSTLVRGRSQSDRGAKEENMVKYRESVELEKCLGLRRSELSNLRKEDLIWVGNRLCVKVIGKGGKMQYQRILPGKEKEVMKIFAKAAPGGLVLPKSSTRNHIDYHTMRAFVARESYDYYLDKIKSGKEEEIKRDLIEYYKMLHRNPEGAKKWLESSIDGGMYKLRGENKKRAEKMGYPVIYNRLALLATSVHHLSHWRLDVTVTNYMLH